MPTCLFALWLSSVLQLLLMLLPRKPSKESNLGDGQNATIESNEMTSTIAGTHALLIVSVVSFIIAVDVAVAVSALLFSVL